MAKSVSELWPVISSLSYVDKIQLIQLVLTEIAQENEGEEGFTQRSDTSFDPRRFFGVDHQPKQVIDRRFKAEVHQCLT